MRVVIMNSGIVANFVCNMGVYYFEIHDIFLVSVMPICPVSLVI